MLSLVLRPGRVSDNMAAILKNGNDPAKSKIDSLMTLGSPRGKFGKFARADGNSQTLYTLCRALSPCSVWCRRSSRSTRSLTGRLSASLSLTLPRLDARRQPQATAWVPDAWAWPPGAPDGWELAAPGIGAQAEASGERKARSGRGQQCDPHFQTLLSTDSRRALT